MTAPLVFSHPYEFKWPGHIFPTGKYRALADMILSRGLTETFHRPRPARRDQLLLGHHEEYLHRLDEIAAGRGAQDPRFECPVTRDVVDAFTLCTGGTILACRVALEEGWAGNIGGGFHHAYPDHGEGFCLLNDAVVAAKVLLAEGRVESILIVDLDVHQGNGTAVGSRDEPRIFTLSLHQENNYPLKEKSDLDVGLADETGDEDYLHALRDALASSARRFSADFVIYLAGADPYQEDRLGGLSMTRNGLAARDRMVFDFAAARDVPVVALLAGGYAEREADVVEIHYRMVEELVNRWWNGVYDRA